MNELLKNFSEELKSRREEIGVTLEEMHSKFRIDIKFLKAIEECEFNILPEIYIKAFIKSYAQAVELDPTEVLKKYELAKSGKSEEKSIKAKEEKEKPTEEPKTFDAEENQISADKLKPKIGSNTIIIISAVILIGILTVVYFMFIKKDQNIIIQEKPMEEIFDNSDRFEVDESPSKSNAFIASQDSLEVNLKALDSSWVKFISDTRDTSEFILLPRRDKKIKALNKIELLIGNSGGIEIYMNEKKLNFTGKKGEVKSVMIDSKGLYNVK